MATEVRTSLNFLKNQLLQVVVENLASAPSSPVEGQIYYNTTDKKFWYYNDSAWVSPEAAGAVSGTLPIVSTPSGTDFVVSINAATTSTAGSMSAADKTKLDNATDANTASAIVQRDGSGDFSANNITANSVTGLAAPSAGSDAVNKTYVDGLVAGLLDNQGSIDCSTNPNYPSASNGDAYVVSVAGKIGGASGIDVNVGDLIVASADNAGGSHAAVGSDWYILETNRDQATDSTIGLVELATQAEVNTGSDTARVVTPATLAGWKTNQNIPGGHTDTFTGTGAGQNINITHNLNTEEVHVTIVDDVTKATVIADVTRSSANVIVVSGTFENTRQYNVTVTGV